MKSSDFKCKKCEHVFEITIKRTEDFPMSPKCPLCGSGSHRVFKPLHSIVKQGKVGNAHNGYKSSPVYIKKT